MKAGQSVLGHAGGTAWRDRRAARHRMRGLENDVYFQVGLLTVIGLSAKNAILIVEFANEMNAKGHELMASTLHACRQRLRPILMTSLAFVFGVLPMATSSGAGSSSQHAVGTGVMGGMISATIPPFILCRCSSCWCVAASRSRNGLNKIVNKKAAQ